MSPRTNTFLLECDDPDSDTDDIENPVLDTEPSLEQRVLPPTCLGQGRLLTLSSYFFHPRYCTFIC